MVTSLGPVAESVFALDLFGRQGAAHFQDWRREVRVRLGKRHGATEEWTGRRRPFAETLWLLESRSSPASAAIDAEDRARTSAAVFEFCQVAVLPYWWRVRNHLGSVRDACGRVQIANGVQALLANLHPGLHWNSPVLEVPGEPDRDVHLDGRGLILCLSVFLHGKSCVIIDAERETGLPALIVSVPIDAAIANDLWRPASSGGDDGADRALSALVGHTRAAALRALADSCTTGELSQRLGISLAGASKHATVLRKAGLVTTARNRNTALHTLTALGSALLDSRGSDLIAQLA